jgi:hypothetical protein
LCFKSCAFCYLNFSSVSGVVAIGYSYSSVSGAGDIGYLNYSSVSGAAAFGYLTFGSRVSDDIISNYSASSPTVLIALIGKQIFPTHFYIICR